MAATTNSRPVSSSPWTQIVRGEASEVISSPSSAPVSAAIEQAVASAVSSSTSTMAAAAAEEESSDNGSGAGSGGGNAVKRPAWNKPLNGSVEIGPVMGADSWPALSESARGSAKSSSDSLKGLSDGSSSLVVSIPQTQVSNSGNSNSSPSTPNHSTPVSTPNHTVPARQRSMKRAGNGANTSFNGGSSQPTNLQAAPSGEVHLNNPPSRDHGQKNSQSRNTNEHPQQQRSSFRNRNGGPHSRGDGSHHHNYGGRRDQDRGIQDWNSPRSFNGRDAHMQPQRGVPRFMRHPPPPPPPPTTAPFIAPASLQPFGRPMGYPELTSPVYYVAGPPPDAIRGMSFVAGPIPSHAVFYPALDLELPSKMIVNQIDYYFSNENLIKDTFLRQNMDDQGWVPIQLIAGFKKVLYLTDNIQLIKEAIRNSTVVEIQDDRVRRRNDWRRWIMPSSVQFPNVSSPQSPGAFSHEMLVADVQSISLGDWTGNRSNERSPADAHSEASISRSSSDLSSRSHMSSRNGAGQASVQGGLDQSTPASSSSK